MLRQAGRLVSLASTTRNMSSLGELNGTQQVWSALTSVRHLSASATVTGAQVGRLNHIAIAVPNLEQAAAAYSKVLGTHVSDPQTLPEHGVRVVFISLANVHLELLEPIDESSPIANFLKKNPAGGMHHMCLEVPNIHAAVDHVGASGVRLLDTKPKIGAHGTRVVFCHPKDMCGVLTELEEVKA